MGLFDRFLPLKNATSGSRKPAGAPAPHEPAVPGRAAPLHSPSLDAHRHAPESAPGSAKGLGSRPRPEAFGVSDAPRGPSRSLTLDLAPFDSLEADISADITWTPASESKARLLVPESFLKLLRIEVSGRKLSISSRVALAGARISIALCSSRLMEIHAAGDSFIEAADILSGRVIATARGKSRLLLAGETAELHLEASDEAVIDAASLRSMIAAADLSGISTVLARVQDALEADLRDESALLTVGTPKIIETRRHAPASTITVGGH